MVERVTTHPQASNKRTVHGIMEFNKFLCVSPEQGKIQNGCCFVAKSKMAAAVLHMVLYW